MPFLLWPAYLSCAGHTIMIISHDSNIPKRTERVFHIKDGLLTEQNNGAGHSCP